MRLWSLDFKYLDQKGFGGLWRETIVAKNALTGKKKGYRNHSQLIRFKKCEDPIAAINYYMNKIYLDSLRRKYNYNKKFIDMFPMSPKIPVTKSQVEYEKQHLLNKLKKRDHDKYLELLNLENIKIDDTFVLIDGEIEEWEKI